MSWMEGNWFSLLQTTGIVAGLFFNGRHLLIDSRLRRVQNLFTLTQHHRSIWLEAYDNPNLRRVLAPKADFKRKPVTLQERIFMNLVILHLSTVLAAMKNKVLPKPAGLDEDIQEFFSLPVPNAVWLATKKYRDQPTIDYVESLLEPRHAGKESVA